MGSLANINIKFSADLKQFSSQMQNAERQMKRVGKSMQKVGKNLSIGVTAPLLAIGVAGVRAWDQQEKAIAQVNAGLKSTGNAVGYTSEQLQKMASELQDNSLFGDEEILKDVTAQLLSFTNIAQDQFARTQQAALDLAARLDGDLKGASIKLGKALNDPVANLGALAISGIQFSDDQKKVIKALAETNQLAEAQTIILDELERQYGGSAEAAAKAGLGPFQQLGMIIGDLSEDFGKLIAEAILPFVDKIKGLAKSFKELNPETKKTIVVIAAMVAAIGPLLLALGFLMTNVIPGLSVAFGGLTKVVILLKAQFAQLNITMLANPIVAITAAVAALVYGFTVLIQKITPAVSKLKTFYNLLASAGNLGKFATLQILDQAEALSDEVKAQDEANKVLEVSNKLLAEYGSKLQAIANIPGTSGAARTAAEKGTAITGTTSNALAQPAIESDFSKEFQNLENLNLEKVRNELRLFQEEQQRLSETSKAVGFEVANAFAGMANSFVDSLGLADDGFQGFVKNIAKTIIQLIAQMLAASISQAIAGAAASGTATGPGAIVATPVFIATAIGGILAAFAAIPSFADGGLIYGRTTAIVGEYPGASSNPEVIAPLNKLREYLSPQQGGITDVNVHGVFEIDGRKLRLVLDRTDRQINKVT